MIVRPCCLRKRRTGRNTHPSDDRGSAAGRANLRRPRLPPAPLPRRRRRRRPQRRRRRAETTRRPARSLRARGSDPEGPNRSYRRRRLTSRRPAKMSAKEKNCKSIASLGCIWAHKGRRTNHPLTPCPFHIFLFRSSLYSWHALCHCSAGRRPWPRQRSRRPAPRGRARPTSPARAPPW